MVTNLQTLATSAFDQALERSFSFYDEASGIPVLLSMLVVVFQSARDATVALPQSRLELYQVAMRAAIERRLGDDKGAMVADATIMLTRVAVAAHTAQSREFDGALVAAALSPELLTLWEQLATEGDGLPLFKVLELASEEGATSGKFQAKHLSFQVCESPLPFGPLSDSCNPR